jgi:arylsulfatase A-like enzyme
MNCAGSPIDNGNGGNTGGNGNSNDDDNTRPNVLFIIMDDMNDRTQYLGDNQANTPNLNRLAAQGVWFANGYTAVPVSNPSRTAMMTGLQPFVTGVYNNNHQLQDSEVVNESRMMPLHFRENGYYTLYAGKIFHNKPSTAALDAMWDDRSNADGGYGPFIKNSTIPSNLYVDKWRDWQPWTGPDTDFPDVVNSRKVVDFLGKEHDSPFFIALGLYRPHTPYTAPKRYFDMYPLENIVLPEVPADDFDDISPYAVKTFAGPAQRENHRKWAEAGLWKHLIRSYLACTTFSDELVGNVLTALENSPYADNTIVVLVGDNGFHSGEKERFGKAALWRQSCNVPFIVSWPGGKNMDKGKVEAPVSLIDIYPTLVSLCGLPAVDALAGNDLSPLMEDIGATWNKPCISTMNPGNFVVHLGNWNYLRYADGVSEELYNIQADEPEFHNLADDPSYAAIKAQLAAYVPKTWAPALPSGSTDDTSSSRATVGRR